MTNEQVHHELLIFEGLLALTNVSSTESVFRDKIVTEGGFSMAAHYLSDKNNNIVLAAAEVLANLSLTDAIQGRANMGRMKQELEMMMALFNSLDLDDTTNIRLLNAVLGFIANIIVNNDVVEFFMQDKNFVIRLAKLVE